MAKNKLFAEDYFDFDLIGLVCTAKEYKLVWHVNEILSIELKKRDDLVLEFQNNIKVSISNFVYKTEHKRIELIKNRLVTRSGASFQHLLDELKQFDFLIKIKDETGETDVKTVLSLLKSVTVIEYAANLEPALVKSRDNLIF